RASAFTGPAATTISDIVYRADSTPARGTLLISWTASITVEQKSVAAGTLSVNLGGNGALIVALVPNQGATPSGTSYKVIFKLDDGTTANETWVVGTTSPTSLAAIRTTQTLATSAIIAFSQITTPASCGTNYFVRWTGTG